MYYFNPPAPCGAGLTAPVASPALSSAFQSTRPVRGGTKAAAPCRPRCQISIHPPRAGRDTDLATAVAYSVLFQSTRPVRGGTSGLLFAVAVHFDFNPPAPCGAGRSRRSSLRLLCYFNPPAPCGAGPDLATDEESGDEISIHPPRAGRDHPAYAAVCLARISIHPPRAGRDFRRQCA